MNPNPQRQMIVIAIAVAVVVLGFVAFRLAPRNSAPAPSPSSSAAASQQLQTEPPQEENVERTYHGIACNPDCDEVIGGYNYAENMKAKTRDDCPDRGSVGFSQGCWAYIDEHASQESP